jgi:hypothetical protein
MKPVAGQSTTLVQRKSPWNEDEEDPIQMKPAAGDRATMVQRKSPWNEDEEDPIQMKSNEQQTPGISPGLESQIQATKGGGEPLPQGTKRFMETAFNSDFSGVRVHTDSQASEMSKGINARAFTKGSDIYFSKGEYKPESTDGKKLLAHELTHFIQFNDRNVKNQYSLGIYRDVTNSLIEPNSEIVTLFRQTKSSLQNSQPSPTTEDDYKLLEIQVNRYISNLSDTIDLTCDSIDTAKDNFIAGIELKDDDFWKTITIQLISNIIAILPYGKAITAILTRLSKGLTSLSLIEKFCSGVSKDIAKVVLSPNSSKSNNSSVSWAISTIDQVQEIKMQLRLLANKEKNKLYDAMENDYIKNKDNRKKGVEIVKQMNDLLDFEKEHFKQIEEEVECSYWKIWVKANCYVMTYESDLWVGYSLLFGLNMTQRKNLNNRFSPCKVQEILNFAPKRPTTKIKFPYSFK